MEDIEDINKIKKTMNYISLLIPLLIFMFLSTKIKTQDIEKYFLKLCDFFKFKNGFGNYFKKNTFVFNPNGIESLSKISSNKTAVNITIGNGILLFENYPEIEIYDCKNKVNDIRIYREEIGKRLKNNDGKFKITAIKIRYNRMSFENIIKHISYYDDKLNLDADKKIASWINDCKKYEDEPAYSDDRIIGSYKVKFYSNKVFSDSYNFQIKINL